VVGIRAELGEDDVLVGVIPHDAAAFDAAELIAFLEPRLPRYMLPRYVQVVEDLPRTEASLRVRKHELRDRGVTEDTWDRDAS
jgi:crotonobetaine/carnitine-CoA ligase